VEIVVVRALVFVLVPAPALVLVFRRDETPVPSTVPLNLLLLLFFLLFLVSSSEAMRRRCFLPW